MEYVLGVDQGGTKTDVVIVKQDGTIIAFENDRGYDPGEHERREKRMRRMRFAVDKALAAAGMSIDDISQVYANCNGADWPFEYEVGRKNIMRTLGCKDVSLFIDCMGAMRGGVCPKNRNTAVVCLGTGGNAAIHTANGREFVYGYYYHDRDQGGGAIGHAVFDIVFDADIGLGSPSLLTNMLLKQFPDCGSIQELFMMITTGREENEKKLHVSFKEYAWLLFDAVRQGDLPAKKFLEEFCQRICHYIVHGVNRMNADKDLTVVLSGGILKIGPEINDIVRDILVSQLPGVACVQAKYEPVIGAILYCMDEWYPDGIPTSVDTTLNACCEAFHLLR